MATSQPAAPSSTGVSLLTGDRALVSTISGRPQVRVLPVAHSGVAASFQQLHLSGHDYVIPAEARPFLGRLLDPSLFDVTKLRSVENNGRIPVSLKTSDAAAVHIPGLSVTARSRDSARGWLDASGAAAIRAELVRDWQQTAGPAHRYPASLFGNVTSLALAGATPPVSPSYPQVTLIVKVLDTHGKPMPFGEVMLFNTDDIRRFTQFVIIENGQARVSVPLGHYSGITDVGDFDPRTDNFVDRIVPIADYTVRSNLQTLAFDSSAATVEPTLSTPRPGTLQQESVELDRADRRGLVSGAGFSYGGGGFEIRVAPTRHVKVGSLYWLTGWTVTGAAPHGTPYSYDLSWAARGSVPASQHHAPKQASLATVTADYYNDQPRDSYFARAPLYPWQGFLFVSYYPLQTPVVRSEYVNGDSGGARWYSSLVADPTESDPFGGDIEDDLRSYAAGSTTRESWQRELLAPAPPQPSAADRYFYCPACRTPSKLAVTLVPFTDSTSGHAGYTYPARRMAVTHFALYRDGKKIAGGVNRIGAAVNVPSGEATYRVTMQVDRSGDEVLTAPALSTDLTFRSSGADGARLPRYWHCGYRPSEDKGCRVLPLLTARMPLPTDLTDRMRIGTSTADLTIAPLGGASGDRITSAAVYTDSGRGFHPAQVQRLGNGHYRVSLHNPASSAGSFVTVRIVAADARGGHLVQTTQAAYIVANS